MTNHTHPAIRNRIESLASDYTSELVRIRRHFHTYPELSFQEAHTADTIASWLTHMGIPFTTGWAGHGIVATLEGNAPGKTLALRADMDALPIGELSGKPYASQNEGVMHACGHDAHMTCLMGAIYILHAIRDTWSGTLRLIFQPAEERFPGGAVGMIEQGVLDNPRPDAIIGLHVLPELPAGQVGFCPGMFMAAADELYITIKGKGGHGAQPHRTIDPVVIAANLIVTLQQIVSRRSDPLQPTVLTFGKIQSNGGATNIIPDSVYLEGTLRTFDQSWRHEALGLIRSLIEDMPATWGATSEIDIRLGNPPLYNDPALTEKLTGFASELILPSCVVPLSKRMGAEDFSSYTEIIPGVFWRLGTKSADGSCSAGLHSPFFDIDESALPLGAAMTAWLAWRFLNE